MAELKEARVPDIGGHGDVPVIELLVKPGDTVARDQGLVTLESDKATMEVPSPFAGVVRELKVKLGDTLSEGGLVAIIEIAAEATGAAVAAAPTPAPPPPPGAQPEAVRPQAAPAEAAAPVAPVAVAATPGTIAGASAASPVAPMGAGLPPVRFDADAVLPDRVPYASPAVRLFARELGVDLMQVTGSERGGRIGKDDVRRFVKAALAGGIAAPVAAAAPAGGGGLNLIPWPTVDFAKFGAIESKPLSR
ncbi:MAG TPA: E3 binding domain-containing protein, partial [Thermomonas sp.]|nr:E3 binding domain-containing protein [Thermomonas sp.]